jgi:hypothetical protein
MKESKSSTRRIDLAVAAVMGVERAVNQEAPVVAPVPQFYA